MKLQTIILLLMFPLSLAAQDVWKEGTEWVVTYTEGDTHTYTLSGTDTIDGMPYLRLTDIEEDELVGLVRAERGDTIVYARGFINGVMTEEFLLYDFGTFEPGTALHYSCYNYEKEAIVVCSLTIDADSLNYFHDVITAGDLLPCYSNVLFKVGYIGGPMDLFYNGIGSIDSEEKPLEPDNPKPRTRNVSHLVFKPKGHKSNAIIPTAIQTPKADLPDGVHIYNLQGVRLGSPLHGIIIQDGKKIMYHP